MTDTEISLRGGVIQAALVALGLVIGGWVLGAEIKATRLSDAALCGLRVGGDRNHRAGGHSEQSDRRAAAPIREDWSIAFGHPRIAFGGSARFALTPRSSPAPLRHMLVEQPRAAASRFASDSGSKVGRSARPIKECSRSWRRAR